jgi:hypothetical protein
MIFLKIYLFIRLKKIILFVKIYVIIYTLNIRQDNPEGYT